MNKEFYHSKRFISLLVIISILMIIILCKYLSWREMRIRTIDLSKYNITGDNSKIQFCVDNAYFEILADTQKLCINGWCIKKNTTPKSLQMHIVLIDKSQNIYYQLPTSIVTRTDVTSHINDGNNYNYSGYSYDAACNQLDFKNSTFEVAILYVIDKNHYFIKTNQVIKKK